MIKKSILILAIMLILTGCENNESKGSNNIKIIETIDNNPSTEEDLILDDIEDSNETEEINETEKPDSPEQVDKTEEIDNLKDTDESNDIKLSYYEHFIYTSFDGDVSTITFGSKTENQINFKILITKYESNVSSQVIIADNCIGTLRGDVLEFDFVDNFNNKGSGTLKFDKDDILLKTMIHEESPATDYSLEAESKLFREETYGDIKTDSSYVFPDSNSRYLKEEELTGLSKEDLGYARNEIFARYGYFFNNPKYASYFHKKTWYDRHAFIIDDSDKPEDYLNDFEIKNIELIKKIENKQD